MNTNVLDTPAATVVAFPQEKRQAIQLHHTTNLTSAAIAAKIGVSKNIVGRWLRSEGISPRHRRGQRNDQDRQDTSRHQDDIAILQRDLTALKVQAAHLERRIEGMLGSKQQSAA